MNHSKPVRNIVARGFSETSHRPARLRSSRNPADAAYLLHHVDWFLGLLRNPTGINPLATEASSVFITLAEIIAVCD
jgi:hypothetical protein